MSHKIYKYNTTHSSVDYSIVVPIYNQDDIIFINLNSYIINTFNPFKKILILDFCSDKSEENIVSFLDNYNNINSDLVQIIIYKNEEPLFETKCDNIGFKASIGKYCLEIQADMEMIEHGYNLHLTKPFNILNNVIAVSGRCCHNLCNGNGVGKLGKLIETPIEKLGVDKNTFYVHDTCNRGPLLIVRNKLIELNYLNEDIYYLDDSDHDLMIRAYLEKNYICGYVPINFNAPLSHGSTRNNKRTTNDQCLNTKKNSLQRQKLEKIYAENNKMPYYKSIWKNKPAEKYKI